MPTLHAVESTPTPIPPLSRDFVGVPLAVIFATGEEINAVRSGKRQSLYIESPYQVSDDDAYLVLPDDIGDEVVDILRDADEELLDETLRDGLLVTGALGRSVDGRMSLEVEAAVTPRDALLDHTPYAQEIVVETLQNALQIANRMTHCQCTMLSALLDAEGLEAMLRREKYIGTSWRVSSESSSDLMVDPTYAYSRHLSDGRVGIELALFVEEEDLIALLRPAVFRAISS